MAPFEGFRRRKIAEITREYERRQEVGFPVTLDGNAETLQVSRDVDRTNWLTVYGLCLDGIGAGLGDAPDTIFIQTTSNARYYMTFNEAATKLFAKWKSANTPRLKAIAKDSHQIGRAHV